MVEEAEALVGHLILSTKLETERMHEATPRVLLHHLGN